MDTGSWIMEECKYEILYDVLPHLAWISKKPRDGCIGIRADTTSDTFPVQVKLTDIQFVRMHCL